MKSLDIETNITPKPEQLADLVMESVSAVMRAIRAEMRESRPVEMSMQQFRALRIVNRHPGSSLMMVAEHLGLTTASASKLIDALVKQELVTREESPEDRRMLVLRITDKGIKALDIARKAALGKLAENLTALDESDRAVIARAMNILRSSLSEEGS